MAKRTIFKPTREPPFYEEVEVAFEWEKGRPSLANARRNAAKLAEAAREQLNIRVIEISRAAVAGQELKAEYDKLSAFKLRVLIIDRKQLPLEVVYQSAKVWEGSGDEQVDLAQKDLKGVKGGRVAKKEANAQRASRARLIKFRIKINDLFGDFPIHPEDAFYNWLYILSLRQEHNKKLSDAILKEVEETKLDGIGFSDIFFKKKDKLGVRYNCQARAVAIFVGLHSVCREELEKIFHRDKSLYDYLINKEFTKESFGKFCECVYGKPCGEQLANVQSEQVLNSGSGKGDSSRKSSKAKRKNKSRKNKSQHSEEQMTLPNMQPVQ